jgi:hypothetical protein
MKERGLTNDTKHAYQMLALLYSTVLSCIQSAVLGCVVLKMRAFKII